MMFQELSLSHVNFMLNGLAWTIGLALIALTGGSMAGSFLALMAVSRNRYVRATSRLYIFVVQGTPLLVTLFIAYFGANYVGFDVPPLVAISIAFSFYAAAFLGEIWRGSIESIPVGQSDGAHALGLSRIDMMRFVIIPQAIKIATPATVGFFVMLIKNTSLASVVGITELTRTAQIVSNATFKPLQVYLLSALFYFLVCFPLTIVSRKLERKLHKS